MGWMSWSPKGDRLAYFVRTEKYRTLVIENVLTRRIEQRIEVKSLDAPESPAFAPNGRTVAFSALNNAKSDIYTVNLDTLEIAGSVEHLRFCYFRIIRFYLVIEFQLLKKTPRINSIQGISLS
jgi:Tol biopolymer transport system component